MAALESELISEDPHVQYIHKNCQDGHISDRFYKNGGCLLPTRYKQFEEQIYNMEVRPDDVWVLSFPKCGTTWTQEMVWLIGHDFDFEAAKELLDERFVFLEFSALGAGFPQDSVDKIVEMKSPRFIKSHLPLPLLPKQFSVVKPKTIYVYRNPKDAAISYYHHFRMWNSFSGSLEKFLGAFVQDKVMYLPFWDNVIPFWKMRKDPNILFITYEDMKKMEAFQSELLTEDPFVQAISKNCGDGHLVDRLYKNGGCLLPSRYKQFEEQIYNMEVRPDDVWVLSFPKCGTTWTQEMVWLLGHDFDFDAAKKTVLDQRFVFLEFSTLSERFPQDSIDKIEKMESPRFIKSHLPLPLLPKQFSVVKPKVIYVYRNPKDAAISYFHHFRMWHSYSGTLEEFVDAFLEEKLMYSPFWDNVIPFWKIRNEPKMLFITYEEMKNDLYTVAKRTADFLGVNITDEVKEKFLMHLSFEEMKKNPSVNYEAILANGNEDGLCFIRSGQSGGWLKLMNKGTIKRFNEKAMKALQGTDFLHYQ